MRTTAMSAISIFLIIPPYIELEKQSEDAPRGMIILLSGLYAGII
jgi:hypothetical protein